MIFIAEIGMNHNGNFDLAFELIKQAKESGADIVKFQLGWRDKEGEINQINEEVLKKLKRWADYFEIEILFSIISEKAFELIKNIDIKRFKIASRTLIDNFLLAEKIVQEGKETIISLGMWDKNELPFSLKQYGNVRYMWCLSKYPTEPIDLISLPKDFKDTSFLGYSDHSIGIETCFIAIARGATIIEKHFTLDKSDRTIRDHALSATPDEFRYLTTVGREIARKITLGV